MTVEIRLEEVFGLRRLAGFVEQQRQGNRCGSVVGRALNDFLVERDRLSIFAIERQELGQTSHGEGVIGVGSERGAERAFRFRGRFWCVGRVKRQRHNSRDRRCGSH